MTKRIVESVVCLVAVILLSPVFLVIAVLVLVDSGRPIFFRQERVGRSGGSIKVIKFRSMSAKASGPGITVEGDPRVTRVGKVLRSTKLDELPQLSQVVAGTLSLVGPRPEIPEYVAHWGEENRAVILSVRPGITDPASREFRRESEILAEQGDPEEYYISTILPQKVSMYRAYVENRSNIGDVKIVFGTIKDVVAR